MEMASTFECVICFGLFDLTDHRPKLVSCGHTFCLDCVRRKFSEMGVSAKCPVDREVVDLQGLSDLKDNKLITSVLEERSVHRRIVNRFHCLNCDKEAGSTCLTEHTLRGMVGYRREKLESLAKRHQEAVATLLELQQEMLAAVTDCVEQGSQQEQECVAVLRDSGDQAEKLLHSAAQLEQELQQLSRRQHVTITGQARQDVQRLKADQLLEDQLLSARHAEVTQRLKEQQQLEDQQHQLATRKAEALQRLKEQQQLEDQQQQLATRKAEALQRLKEQQQLEDQKQQLANRQAEAVQRLKELQRLREQQQLEEQQELHEARQAEIAQRLKEQQQLEEQQQQFAERLRLQIASRDKPSSLLVEKDVTDLCMSSPGARKAEKDALLKRDHDLQVDVLRGVWCASDPVWVLALLRRHAKTLQDLQLYYADRDHLEELQTMPELHRLHLSDSPEDLRQSPALLEERWQGQLRSLHVWDVPRQTVLCLLAAHSDSLQELELHVGTPSVRAGQQEDHWPLTCSDLPLLLQRCGLHRLRSLTLLRPAWAQWPTHSESLCSVQLLSLRASLPNCSTIKCDTCPSL